MRQKRRRRQIIDALTVGRTAENINIYYCTARYRTLPTFTASVVKLTAKWRTLADKISHCTILCCAR